MFLARLLATQKSKPVMATSKHNQPVESTCDEYLHDTSNEMSDTWGTTSSLHDVNHSAELQTLTKKLMELENMGTSTQLEIQEMRRQVDELKKDETNNKEKIKNAEARQQEAESYAITMATERECIAHERHETLQEKLVIEERLQMVLITLKIAERERDEMEKAYQEKLAKQRRTHKTEKNTLQMWEEEMKQLKAENAELKRENGFLRETFFAVNPNPSDRQKLKCFSCQQSYSTESQAVERAHTANECFFHPLPPVPPSVWHRWQQGPLSRYRQSEYAKYSYWSCCNVLASKGRRPDGCREGPHHQKWEMDVMMKRIMLSRDILDEEDEEQEPKIA